jgi:hypothetical protein
MGDRLLLKIGEELEALGLSRDRYYELAFKRGFVVGGCEDGSIFIVDIFRQNTITQSTLGAGGATILASMSGLSTQLGTSPSTSNSSGGAVSSGGTPMVIHVLSNPHPVKALMFRYPYIVSVHADWQLQIIDLLANNERRYFMLFEDAEAPPADTRGSPNSKSKKATKEFLSPFTSITE